MYQPLARLIERINTEHPPQDVDAVNDAGVPKKDPLAKVFSNPKEARLSAEILALRDGDLNK